jgi:hypothetical protein
MGAVRFSDGQVWFYEYNGTSDYTISHLYATPKEVSENWRSDNDLGDCKCGRAEELEAYTNYGGGYYLEVKACKHCKTIVSEPDFDIIESNDTDHWAREFFEEEEDDNQSTVQLLSQ